MNRRTSLFIVLVVFFVLSPFVLLASAQTEQITLTTYYPAPFGVYQELAARRMKIGANYMLNTTVVGDNMLIVEGNIGIGIAAPTRPLTIVSPSGQSAIQIQSPLPFGGETGIGFVDTTSGTQVRLRYLRTGFQELNVDGNVVLEPAGGVPSQYLVRAPNGQICIRYRYASQGGLTFCPFGYSAINGNNSNPAPISGYLYCCR